MKIDLSQCLKQDRILSIEPDITIGISGFNKTDNPLSIQKLRINNDKLVNLLSFTQTDKSICYEFEKDIMLCFKKSIISSEIILDLKTDNNRIIKIMDPMLINRFKSPHFGSPEFDLIESFIKCK